MVQPVSGTMALDLNALRAFHLVVEAGGVTEAARRAGLPKSTLSRQVRELEARLGEALLLRQGRGLAPTHAGRRLHETAREALGSLEALRHGLRAAPVAGRVRVRAPVMLARGLLQEMIATFLGRHPAIAVEVTLGDRFADAGDADVMFRVGLSPGAAPGRPVGMVEARLYAAPALLGDLGAPEAPVDLARWPVLAQGCAPGGNAVWTLTDARGRAHGVGFTPRLVASDPDLLIAAAVAGRGVCRLATFMAEPHLRAGRLVPVLEGFWAERHAVAVATFARARDPAVARFADDMTEALRERLANPRAYRTQDLQHITAPP